jgi:FkbM family methyltransferase
VNFTTHGPMTFDMTTPEVADWLRDAHKDSWTIEPFTCLVLETLADLFGLTTALDVGTHFGFISQFMLRMPQMTRVDGIEMNPGAAAAVAAHHALTPDYASRYHMHLAGLSDKTALDQTIWYDGMRLSFEKHGRFQEAQLDILSLTDLVDRIGDMPGLIKIDIEGFEGRLVDDLNTLLDTHRPKVLLELHWDEIVERHGATRRDIMMAFLSRGYHCGRLQWHQKMPKAGFMQEVTLDNLDEMLGNKNHAMFALF